jgi:N-acetylglucosamine-6-phosphate deacetylase
VDASAAVVVPGYLDIHTHGANGVQVIDGDAGDLERLAEFYAEHGVTGFLATIGGSQRSILHGIAAVRTHLEGPRTTGARCLGIHLEGPFLSPSAIGAFRPSSLRAADPALLEQLIDAAGGHLRLMTIAPDLPGALPLIELATRRGVRCSLGHSVATSEEATAAVDAGASSVTHVFNAMAPLHHRSPGILGVALTDSRLVTEVIADGVHVHPVALRLLAAAKGTSGVVLVTDSIAAAGLTDGSHHFEEQPVVVTAGAARLADGTLAGSTLTMDAAVTNFAEWAGLAWHDAVMCATSVPARVLGLEASKGAIVAGMDADLAAYTSNHQLLWTMVGGSVRYARSSSSER